MLYRAIFLVTVGLLVSGCESNRIPKQHAQQDSPSDKVTFDPVSAGTVTGQVLWSGEAPQVPSFMAPAEPLSDASPVRGFREWPNPNAPTIDSSGGVGQAVVMLRGVDCDKAKPWDYPPVGVECEDHQLHIRQGRFVSRYGFVHRGEHVEFVSKDAAFYAVQARGAAFFALVLPEPNVMHRRVFGNAGVVELASGAGHYWMRGYLFVIDHPYITVTDEHGSFTLQQVPAGKYEVVAWHPNWLEANHSRDADTCQICRMTFRPRLEAVQTVEVGVQETRNVQIKLSLPK